MNTSPPRCHVPRCRPGRRRLSHDVQGTDVDDPQPITSPSRRCRATERARSLATPTTSRVSSAALASPASVLFTTYPWHSRIGTSLRYAAPSHTALPHAELPLTLGLIEISDIFIIIYKIEPKRKIPSAAGMADVMADVRDTTIGLVAQAVRAGVNPARIVIDPAHDFGKNTWHSWRSAAGSTR